MWTMLLLLWSVPLAAAILILARLGDGMPALTDEEAKFVLGDGDAGLSPRLLLELVVIGLFFFAVGIFEGLVLANFGTTWLIVAPLLTGIAAIGIVACRLRSAPPYNAARLKAARASARHNRFADFFTR